MASSEELLETADGWMLDFDEDEDGRLTREEMVPMMEQMKAESPHVPPEMAGQLTPAMLMNMADHNKDGMANKAELLDLLRRMKGYDSGRLKRDEANMPTDTLSAEKAVYGEDHEARMKKKRKRKRKSKDHTLLPKDEV